MTVAALYISKHGPYWNREGVDAWDETRDARNYDGPHPVVAHPPCQLWVNLAAVNWKRYQRQLPAWYPGGDDGGCFAHALQSVLTYGGVLEPAELDWTRKPGTHQVGWFDRNKPTLSKIAANVTPPPFADALIALARGAV